MTSGTDVLTEKPDLVTIIQAYNDVTERLKRSHERLACEVCRLREELQEKNRELQRKARLASLGQMAAGVAHEIRNPLGGIGLYASLLQRDLADRPGPSELLRKMCSGIRNLDSIVGDILAFAGDGSSHLAPVALARVLDDVRAQTQPDADAAKVKLNIDDQLRSVRLFADGGQIERALINLTLNAIDACNEGGNVRIRDGGRAADGLARIVVEDDGRGIDSDVLHRVFDPFFTTKEKGTGLGLAIVHRIAEANGGSVSASRRRRGGAMFVLSVPTADQDDNENIEGGGR